MSCLANKLIPGPNTKNSTLWLVLKLKLSHINAYTYVPTEKLVSIILEPSSGSKATEYLPPPVIGFSTGTSSLDAVATTPDASKLSNSTLSARTSMASCSSPKSLKHDILSHDAVRILYAISLHASKIPDVHSPKSLSTRESHRSSGSPVAIIRGTARGVVIRGVATRRAVTPGRLHMETPVNALDPTMGAVGTNPTILMSWVVWFWASKFRFLLKCLVNTGWNRWSEMSHVEIRIETLHE